MTEEFLHKIADSLSGTCDSIEMVLARMDEESEDYDTEQIENDLLDHDLERCPGCSWWFECGELFSDNDKECGKCKDCR